MDGENNGKPYEQMDDLGGPPLFLETPIYIYIYDICIKYIIPQNKNAMVWFTF